MTDGRSCVDAVGMFVVEVVEEVAVVHRCTCVYTSVRFVSCGVCVSLQPIPEVYNLFDQVVLLQEGHAVYAGPRTGAFRGVVVVK